MSKLDSSIQKLIGGINTDVSPNDQPEGTYRFALNCVNQSDTGDIGNLITEQGNILFKSTKLNVRPYGYTSIEIPFSIIGSIYIGDDEHAIFGVTANGSDSFIGILNKNITISLYDRGNKNLKFSIEHQITGEYRLRNGCEKTIYWVDGVNSIRSLNFSENYNSDAYNQWLEDYNEWLENQTLPLPPYVDNEINYIKLKLIKHSEKVPTFENIEVVSGGNLKSGTYNFAIKYVDDNGNDTVWLSTSQLVSIYKSSTTGSNYDGIVGSINDTGDGENVENVAFGETPANKRIELTIDNLDESYPFYRIGVIEATSDVGTPTRVLESTNQLIKNKIFVHDGNESKYTVLPVEDLISDVANIDAAQHIEQIEDRLIIANTKNNTKDYCSLQRFASLITSEYVVDEIETYNASQVGDSKNPKSYFEKISYMGGEVYAFGIVYIFEDGTQSPAYHIPGRPETPDGIDRTLVGPDNRTAHIDDMTPIEAWRIYDTASGSYVRPMGNLMAFWEMSTGEYDPKETCDDEDYWGIDGYDYSGQSLTGQKIRHHRFPNRVTIPHHESVGTITTQRNTIIKITLDWLFKTPGGELYDRSYVVVYDVETDPINDPGVIETKTIQQYITKEYINDPSNPDHFYSIVVEGTVKGAYVVPNHNGQPNPIYPFLKHYSINDLDDGIPATKTVLDPVQPYWLEVAYGRQTVPNEYGTLNLLGIKFDNIQLPDGVSGYRIVRAERDNFNRTVLAKGYSGVTKKVGDYMGFARMIEPYCHPSNANPPDHMFDSFNKYILTPESLFENKEPEPSYVKVERVYEITGSRNEGAFTDVYQNINDESTGFIADSDGYDWVGTFSYIKVATVNNTFPLTGGDDKNTAVLDVNYLLYTSSKSGYDISIDPSKPDIKKLYNGSMDNKVGIFKMHNEYKAKINNPTDPSWGDIVPSTRTKKIYYTSLLREIDVHPILDNIEYFQTKNNIQTGTSNTNFGGDTFISHFYLTNTTYQGFTQAERILDFVAKALIVVVGAIIAVAGVIFTGGTVTIAVGIAIGAIIAGASASIIQAGYEEFFDDYALNGLDKLIFDCSVDHTKNDVDDTFYNSMEHIYGMFVESDINVSLRQDADIDAPGILTAHTHAATKEHMVNKCLSWDDAQSAYKYYSIISPNIYKVNKDYGRMNKEKVWFSLPYTYDCCSDCREEFPNRIYYSEKSFIEERFDNFSKFKALNYITIPGEHGEITNIFAINNAFFAHTKNNLWFIPENIQERVTGDIVSLIGTGGFFGATPRKIIDSDIGAAGSTQKFATIKTPIGVFFVDHIEGVIYLLGFSSQAGTKLDRLSDKGISKWFIKNSKFKLENQMYDNFGITYKPRSNPANPNGIGYHSVYDYKNQRFILTKKDKYLSQSTISTMYIIDDDAIEVDEFMKPYIPCNTSHIEKLVFNKADNKFYHTICKKMPGVPQYFLAISNFDNYTTLDSFMEKDNWTISFSNGWTSFHNYYPDLYIHSNKKLFSVLNNEYEIWKHNIQDTYLNFYGHQFPFIIDYVAFKDPLSTTIYDNIILQTSAYRNGIERKYVTFNKMIVYNDRQSSGELILEAADSRPDADYMMQTVKNVPGTLKIRKEDRDWFINGFRDYVIRYDEPLFLPNDNNLVFMDKIVNQNVIDFNKSWESQERFKDKYLRIRLIFDNKIDTKLISRYNIESEQNTNI